MKYRISILMGCMMLFSAAYSQGIRKNKISYIVQGGLATYTGELSYNFQTFTYKPAAGLGIAYRINPYLSGRMDMNFFKLGGEHYTLNNSISFSSNNAELSANLVFDLIPQKKSFKYRKDIVPYLFAGVGMNVYKSSVSRQGDLQSYSVLNEHNGTHTIPVIPLGIGFKFKAGAFTDIYVECGYRKTFTGSLDNIGTISSSNSDQANTVGEGHVSTPPSVKTLHTDGYFVTSFKIAYTPNNLFKKKIQSATPQSKWATRENKKTWRQISKNKKLASDKIRVAYNQ